MWLFEDVRQDGLHHKNPDRNVGFFVGANLGIRGFGTAVTIWTLAPVGMGIGACHYFASACASLLILFVLAVLPYIAYIIDLLNQSKVYSVSCPFH